MLIIALVAINFSSADVDYDNIPPSVAAPLVFDPLNNMRTVNITVLDNPPLEPIEFFFGELSTFTDAVVLDSQQANISITDNDCKLVRCLECWSCPSL